MANKTRPSFGGFGQNIEPTPDIENLSVGSTQERPRAQAPFFAPQSKPPQSNPPQSKPSSQLFTSYAFEADCECGFVARSNTEFGFNKSWDAHQLKCPSLNSQASSQGVGYQSESTSQSGPNFSNYTEIEGFITTIPPDEVDLTSHHSFVCKYGCKTKTNGNQRRFLSKYSFLEHIAREHPRVRIVLESPPSMDGQHEGTRTVIHDMDPLGR
jgi:hypothetical protein